MHKAKTLTAQYLNGDKKIDYLHNRPQEDFIKIKNVTINNIKNLDVQIPLKKTFVQLQEFQEVGNHH